MNWKIKWRFIQSLSGSVDVVMQDPEHYTCSPYGVEIADNGILSSATGHGTTARHAVEDCWQQLTSLPSRAYVVTDAYKASRRAMLWNGSFFEVVRESVSRR